MTWFLKVLSVQIPVNMCVTLYLCWNFLHLYLPPLLSLPPACCTGRGRGEGGSYPRSLSTSDEHMGNGAGGGEWGGYYPGGTGRATTTGWTPGWEGTLPPTPSRGDKDTNWRSPAKDPNGKWSTPPSPGVCVHVCVCAWFLHVCVRGGENFVSLEGSRLKRKH